MSQITGIFFYVSAPTYACYSPSVENETKRTIAESENSLEFKYFFGSHLFPTVLVHKSGQQVDGFAKKTSLSRRLS
jgi:hypothetical protein